MRRLATPREYIRRLFSTSDTSRFQGIANDLKLTSAYIDFSTWKREQPRTIFNDGAGPGKLSRFDLYRHVLLDCGLAESPIDYIEFGVYAGESIRWWTENATHPESTFTGFDTFTGLPDAWGGFPAGHFSTEGLTPDVPDERCSWQVGLFQQTLPRFLRDHDWAHTTLVHFDADLFTSTLYAFASVAPRLKPGDVILFDEFSTVLHEFRAYIDVASAFKLRCRVLGAVNDPGRAQPRAAFDKVAMVVESTPGTEESAR